MNSYREEPIQIGAASSLLGVITRPNGPMSSTVACLMFNFGVTHRVGPRRIQAKLARQLARQGFATLRFDLSGLGDSRASDTSQIFEEQAMNDLRTAVDEIEKRLGIRQIVVIGLCSGAGHGFRISIREPRVVGLLSFDGYAFTSRISDIERRVRRFLRFPVAQTRHWIERLLGKDRPDGDLLKTGAPARAMGPRAFGHELHKMVARGMAVYFIYSGTLQSSDRRYDQLYPLRNDPVLEKVRYEFMPRVDHSFTTIEGQTLFIDAACRWVEEVEQRRVATGPAVPIIATPTLSVGAALAVA